ncbi:MAG: acyl-CoA dehydrogenase family protein, partial [Henriciella sp.]|nr:acyl-CoA dehydrogenase family protein [Henriciella sp.]
MATQIEPATQTDEDAFRAEVQQFLADNFPEELKGTNNALAGVDGPTNETPAQKKWREAMGARGWGTPTWPREYGGGGLSKAQAKILEQEMGKAGAYNPIGGMGVMMFGPTLLEYGSEEQKHAHIPPIARGAVRWCQGYSEPNAGSDLANLQTFAEDKGDHYLVNGQKTWTSGGQWADKCFAIVRTDKSDKHKGISFMLIDMDSPGVEVRPITMISGTSPFCETFFTDVKVPKENLVGEEGQGWTIGKRLLQHERTNISGGGSLARLMGQSLGEIAKKYQPTGDDGELADAVLRDKIADFEIRWNSFLLTARRAVEESKAQGGVSEISSVLKKLGTKLS